ncbi:MAG: glutathione peroxidase [Candidatus Falkowbacteria bacterium]
MNNFYNFEAENIKGERVKMSDYQGKMVLVVNVASHCGFTPQYAGLEKLYQDYKDQGLIILAFPCNQFAGQEPGEAAEIMSFCQLNYGVTFPIFSKIKVNGKEAHPLYNYLKSELPDILGARIKWNFTKFLIDRQGRPLKRFSPQDTPEMITKYLQKII